MDIFQENMQFFGIETEKFRKTCGFSLNSTQLI